MSSEVKRWHVPETWMPVIPYHCPSIEVVPASDFDRVAADLLRSREALRAAMEDVPGWCDLARAALSGKETP